MTQYAKIVDNQLVCPTADEFRGIPNWQTHDALLRKHGYLPLAGEPDLPAGHSATPATWHIVAQSETHDEPRNEDPVTHEPFIEDVMEPDPETGEMVKTGERQVTKIVPVTFDTSYIAVDSWDYEPIPVPPPPEPEPVIYSKLKIVKAMLVAGIWGDFWAALSQEQKTLWENAVNFSSAYPEFAAGLAAFKQAFPQIDADAMLEECIAD